MVNSIKQRIVVLGAAGFIGFHLSNKLSDRKNVSLILVDNFIRGIMDSQFKFLISKTNVTFIEKDLTREDSYLNLFQNGDIILNCAALNGTQNFYAHPVEVIRHSAVSAIFASEYAAKACSKKYIYFGTPESYAGGVNLGFVNIPTPETVPLVIDDPLNLRWSYGASKTIGEIAAIANQHQFGLITYILRVHNIYGPRMGKFHVVPDLVEKFISGNYEVKGLDESRSFMYIDDLISVLEKFIFEMESQDNIIFNVGSRTETLISELAIIIAKVLGINPPISPAQSFPGSVKRRLADVNLLENYMNVNETSLEDGLIKYIKWYRANS